MIWAIWSAIALTALHSIGTRSWLRRVVNQINQRARGREARR